MSPADEIIDLRVVLHSVIAFVRRHRWMLIGAAVLGLAFGIYRYRSAPDVWRGDIVLFSPFALADGLAKHCRELNARIPSPLPPSVVHLEAYRMRTDQYILVPSSRRLHGALITVTLSDTAHRAAVTQAIVDEVKRSPYVRHVQAHLDTTRGAVPPVQLVYGLERIEGPLRPSLARTVVLPALLAVGIAVFAALALGYLRARRTPQL